MSEAERQFISTSIVLDKPYLGARWVIFSAPQRYLPRMACCYCIFVGGNLLYVGQTANLRARISGHKASGRFPEEFLIKARFGEKYGDWAMREMRLIRRLRPPMNLRVI